MSEVANVAQALARALAGLGWERAEGTINGISVRVVSRGAYAVIDIGSEPTSSVCTDDIPAGSVRPPSTCGTPEAAGWLVDAGLKPIIHQDAVLALRGPDTVAYVTADGGVIQIVEGLSCGT